MKQLLSCALGLVIFCSFSGRADAQINELNHYDVLPEYMVRQAKPNVLLIFDNSGSMRWDLNGKPIYGPGGSVASPKSRSHIARTAFKKVLDGLTDKVNMGLMVYDAQLDPGPDDVLNDTNRPCTRTGPNNWGALLFNLRPYDAEARDTFKALLDTEPRPYNDDDLIKDGIIKSAGCTPIAGTFHNALEYLVEGNLSESRNHTGEAISPPPELPYCPASLNIIWVTDGQATAKNSTIGCENTDPDSQTPCAVQKAKELYAAGVNTYVIGFAGLNKGARANLTEIANAGSVDRFGKPRDFYPAKDGTQLVEVFELVINTISQNASSGGRVAITNSANQDVASFSQTYFVPSLSAQDDSGRERVISWVGFANSLFIDEYSFIREDDGDKKLEGYDVDKAVRFENNEEGETVVTTLNISTESGRPVEVGIESSKSLYELDPIWELSDSLHAIDQDTIAEQREYSAASQQRYIFTNIENKEHDLVWGGDNGLDESHLEYLFVENPFDGDRIDLDDKISLAQELINWTRGDESTNLRNRTLILEGKEKRHLLGDSIHAAPVLVGPPDEAYFEKYGDVSYKTFREKEENRTRRSMVYIGANDGMIHAVNAGTYDEVNRQFLSENFELGFEMWAYIPQSLLPHLRFWANPNYNSHHHVYGVDGQLTSFDIKVGEDDWRTYLVASTGYGGHEHQVDINQNGVFDGDLGDKTLTPSVVIIDVTDPDSKPRLVAEITHPEFGAMVSKPVLVKQGDPTKQGKWFIAFGTGPNNIKDHVRDDASPAKVFLYEIDESSATLVPSFPRSIADTSGGFTGNMAVVDWNLDYIDDAVYFGVSMGTSGEQTGKLIRMSLSNDSFDISELLSEDHSFDNEPYLVRDGDESWVFLGSGRINTYSDFDSREQNAFYGIRESFLANGEVDSSVVYSKDELQDVTGFLVFSDGSIEPSDQGADLPSRDGQPIATYSELRQYIRDEKLGWYRYHSLPDNQPSERIPGQASSPGLDILTYTGFEPKLECGIKGNTNLYTVSFDTGTAPFSTSLRTDPDNRILLPDSSVIEGGILVKYIDYPRNTPIQIGTGPGGEEAYCRPGDASCDPCVAGGPGYPDQCNNSCNSNRALDGLCLGSDGSSPICAPVLYGTCGLGRNSWKEINARY